MPSGACVVEYAGKRGHVFRLKYRDAQGAQTMETLGRAADGWTRKRAERELGVRLAKVEEGLTRETRETFAAFVADWRERWIPAQRLKPSTAADYGYIIDGHLLPYFSETPLQRIDVEQIDGYIAAKTAAGLSAKTIRNHLGLLRVILKTARRWKRIRENPLDDVDPPKVTTREMVILSEDEVARLLTALRERGERNPDEAVWWTMTRRMVLVVLGTAIRRGELLGLRWGDVDLLNRRLEIRQAWVRNAMTTPKSTASRRSIRFGLKTAAALEEQFQATAYKADEALVFGHPELGTPLDPSELTRSYLKPALKAAAIDKPLQPWHGLRHTALTFYATTDEVTPSLVQARAGHSQFAITERYIHAAQVVVDGVVERTEERLFGPTEVESPVET
jgi:integrase